MLDLIKEQWLRFRKNKEVLSTDIEAQVEPIEKAQPKLTEQETELLRTLSDLSTEQVTILETTGEPKFPIDARLIACTNDYSTFIKQAEVVRTKSESSEELIRLGESYGIAALKNSDEQVQEYWKLLQSSEGDIRVGIVRILPVLLPHLREVPEDIDTIITAISQDKDPRIYLKAPAIVLSLAKIIKDKQRIRALYSSFMSNALNYQLRKSAGSLLAELITTESGSLVAQEWMRRGLSDEIVYIDAGLGSSHEFKAVAHNVLSEPNTMVDDTTSSSRVKIAESLSALPAINEVAYTNILQKLFFGRKTDDDPLVRKEAAKTLGSYFAVNPLKAMELIHKLLISKDQHTRWGAVAALKQVVLHPDGLVAAQPIMSDIITTIIETTGVTDRFKEEGVLEAIDSLFEIGEIQQALNYVNILTLSRHTSIQSKARTLRLKHTALMYNYNKDETIAFLRSQKRETQVQYISQIPDFDTYKDFYDELVSVKPDDIKSTRQSAAQSLLPFLLTQNADAKMLVEANITSTDESIRLGTIAIIPQLAQCDLDLALDLIHKGLSDYSPAVKRKTREAITELTDDIDYITYALAL